MIKELRKDLEKLKNPKQAKLLQRFFKTGKGEYGEGDIFLGIKVPEQRKLVNKYKELEIKEVQGLLNSKIHEERLVGLLILVEKYKKTGDKKKIIDFYLDNTHNINNWDLVDLTASKILGDYLLDKNRKILYKLARSNALWERRISIVATGAFIWKNDFKDSIKISEILLKDNHDLIHKAVGWMLREVGKRNVKVLEDFLKKHYKEMPRTMLRYSIEKFSEKRRKEFLNGDI